MIFSAAITTPANTPESAPVKTVIPITMGIIHELDIFFPSGALGLHRAIIRRGQAQIMPANVGGYFSGEDEHISAKEYIEVDDYPTEIEVWTWNLDETYAHTVLIKVGVLRKNIIAPWLVTWQEKLGL